MRGPGSGRSSRTTNASGGGPSAGLAPAARHTSVANEPVATRPLMPPPPSRPAIALSYYCRIAHQAAIDAFEWSRYLSVAFDRLRARMPPPSHFGLLDWAITAL